MTAKPEPESVELECPKKNGRGFRTAAQEFRVCFLVQRCVPVCVDVRSIWVDVLETFPGVEESDLIDRFLDTVVTRARHAERLAEAR